MQQSSIFKGLEDVSDKKQAAPVHQALVWVHKAKAGSIQWVDKCTEEQFDYYCTAKKMKMLGTIAKYGLLLCTLFDMPSWCRGTPEACSSYVKQLYSPGFPILPQRGGAGISIIFWLILGGRMRIRKLAMGTAYSFHEWHLFTAVVITIGTISAFISLVFPMVYNLSVLCRPFAFMGCTKSLRKGFAHILVSVPGFIDVLISLAICVFVCVWVGMVLFARTQEGYTDFFAWRQGFAQMWILFTTNNTPDVVMPAYNAFRGYFWFFLAYLLITVFLLGNVLLAKVYDTYKDVMKEDYKQKYENQRVSVTRAFSFLSDSSTGIISPHTWREFFVAYCDPKLGGVQVSNPDDVDYNLERANNILATYHDVNVEQSNGINFDQFKSIMRVFFDSNIHIARKRPPPAPFRFEIFKQLHNFILHGSEVDGRKVTWDGTMDCVILLGTCTVFYESWMFAHQYNVNKTFRDFMGHAQFWMLCCFSLIYVFGISAKISSLGFERFWFRNTTQHRFDFFNVYGLIVIELLYIFVWPNLFMIRMFMIFHMARGMRLFYYIEPLQQFFALMTRLVPVYWQMGMILFIVYWIFCDIGQIWFGGLIYTSNPNLVGTDFASSGYDFYELNFNCFLDGMVTLFTLMCMNNWSDTSDGYMQVTQSYMSQAYFVAFTLICNMIILNILIALILDCTGALKEELEKQGERRSQSPEGLEAEIEAHRQGVDQDAIMRKIVGADEDVLGKKQDSSSDSSSALTESEGEAEKRLSQDSMHHTISRTKVKKKTSGLQAPVGRQESKLSQEEQTRFDELLGTPSSHADTQKRKSIG